MTIRLPLAFPGQRIGLLGGSFDPPHQGHVHISRRALRRAGLDRVWWLVSPGNPLKERGPADLDRRLQACRAIAQHPKIIVSDVERHLGSPYTAHTLAFLCRRNPGVRFVWLMGADNLAQFHRWENWRWIIETFPMLVFARPGQQLAAGLGAAARAYPHLRRPPDAAPLLGLDGGPGWALLPGPMTDISSTRLRAQSDWP